MSVIDLYPSFYEPPSNKKIPMTKSELDKQAPEIPTDTCPYINFIQQVLDEIKDETSSKFIESKIGMIHDQLEYIRESNEALRANASFWRIKYINKGKKKS